MPRTSRRLIVCLLLPACVLVGTLVALHAAGVPLGQGSFEYRYSHLWAQKLLRLPFALAAILVLYLAVRGATRTGLPARSRCYAAAGVLGLAGFVYFAPPMAILQHYLNFMSPSHEGAFVLELRSAPTATAYVSRFPQRQAMSIEEIKGTRVLSNPPGTTLLAYTLRDTWPPGGIEDYLRAEAAQTGEMLTLSATALKLSAVLMVIWAVSVVPLYFAARLVGFAPAASLASAILAVFCPSALLFSPGKDTAQIFLVALQLLGTALAVATPTHAYAAGLGQSSRTRAAVGGALLAAATLFGAVFSLLLLWTGLVALLFLLIRLRRTAPVLGSAVIGGLIAGAAVYLTLRLTVGLDLLSTTLAVSRKFAEVQPQIRLDLSTWRLIGAPLFALFLPAGLISILFLRRPPPGTGGWLLLLLALPILALTYYLGVPYELPRLWAVMVPLLTLGVFAASAHTYSPRSARLLALVAAVSLLAAAVQWTQLDVRESEYRLITQRNLD